SPRLRAFVMLLCDSGLGRGEAVRLRVSDFHFDEPVCRITTQRVKTGEQIETFCTKTTADAVKQIITNKRKQKDDYVFVKQVNSTTADSVANLYARALRRAGLAKKLRVADGEARRDHRYFQFHLHIFRKRWFTKAVEAGVPDYIVHAMLGRKQYLSQYLQMPLASKQAHYRKIARQVSVFEPKATKGELITQMSTILGKELTEAEFDQMRNAMLQFATLPK